MDIKCDICEKALDVDKCGIDHYGLGTVGLAEDEEGALTPRTHTMTACSRACFVKALANEAKRFKRDQPIRVSMVMNTVDAPELLASVGRLAQNVR